MTDKKEIKIEAPEKFLQTILRIGDIEVQSIEPLSVCIGLIQGMLQNKNIQRLLDIQKKKKILRNSMSYD